MVVLVLNILLLADFFKNLPFNKTQISKFYISATIFYIISIVLTSLYILGEDFKDTEMFNYFILASTILSAFCL